MKNGLCYLEHGWIFLLVGIFCTIGCPSPSTATAPHVLRNIQVMYQKGQWYVVLSGSETMTYKAIKVTNPLRLVVDLSNTVSQILSFPPTEENNIIGEIKTRTLAREPQPLTRVEIGLKRDTSYKISRLKEHILVRFDTSPLLAKAAPVQVGRVVESKVKSDAPKTRDAQDAAILQRTAEEPMALTQSAEKESLHPASKILAIQWVTSIEKISFDIIADGRLDNHDVFVLTDPLRLVVDLLGVQYSEVKDDLNLSGPWVKRIRVGVHPDKVRVVFDLLAVPEGRVPYKVELGDDRLVISF